MGSSVLTKGISSNYNEVKAVELYRTQYMDNVQFPKFTPRMSMMKFKKK